MMWFYGVLNKYVMYCSADIISLAYHWSLPSESPWYDTAASPYLYRPDIFRIVGATVGHDKILWATDFPLMSYSRMLAYTAQAGMDAATSAMVMGENAAQLLGIPVK